jgi:AAA domain
MAIFLPEWQRASGRDLQIKRVLNALDDAFLVRRPLRPQHCAADWFVQHPGRGWLAMAVSATAFDELDGSRLFDGDEQARFEQRLADLQRLEVPALVILWACSTEQARALGRAAIGRFGVRLVSREQFARLGVKLISGLLEPLPEAATQQLLGTWFPETEIAAVCTTQRFASSRDNRARLQRFFLDRDQEWAAKVDLELPAQASQVAGDFGVRLLNGVAGSGKTLIAVHRALLLAELFPRQRILLLIHNTPIVADLLHRLRLARGELPPNLEVLTFFAWAVQQWRRVFGTLPRMPEDPRLVRQLLRQQRRRWPELKFSDEQLATELDFINEALIGDEAAYLAAPRSGRGFALRAAERSQVWALRQAMLASLRDQGLMPWSALPRSICAAATRRQALQRYDHILVDEAQFFAPSWFELVKRSLAEHGQLFLCADPKQGFMRHRLSWKSAGLEVAGRTRKLRRSYRTTRALLASATALVDALVPGDREEDLEPDFAGMEGGTRPLLLYAASPQDALDRLVNELAALADEDLPLAAFLVMYGDNVNKKSLYAQLVERFGVRRVWWFNERSQKKAPPGGRGQEALRLAFLDTATGLEASVVFLIGAEPLFARAQSDSDSDSAADDEAMAQREDNVRKLYMALTRAGRKLVLLSSQPLPPRLEALFDIPERDAA